MSDFIIRSMSQSESALLKEFTYLAIYVPNGAEKPDKGIVERPELNLYYQDFDNTISTGVTLNIVMH